MTLLENIYHHLYNNGLVNNREHFSTHYLGKSKSWYAVQTHKRRDFSTSAAIECLSKIRCTREHIALMSENQKIMLANAEKELIELLAKQKIGSIMGLDRQKP